MTLSHYKSYTILTVGLSRYIYRPGQEVPGYRESNTHAPGWAGTLRESREWINEDIKRQKAVVTAA